MGKADTINKRSWTKDYDNTFFGFLGFGEDMMTVEKWGLMVAYRDDRIDSDI